MIIFVKDLNARTLILDISPRDSIIEIKNKIHEKVGIYTKFMVLIFAGIPLQNESKVCDCNIAKESTLHMLILPRFEGA